MKSGYVALIGRPNCGKSTLLNRLIGQKVAIVSDKPQTTRNRILGILTTDEAQIIFVDTPGIHRPEFRLNEWMMDTVYQALRDVDLVVHLVDSSAPFGHGEQFVLDLVRESEKPAILALNKVDLINKGKLLPMMEEYGKQLEYQELVPLSASTGENVFLLLDRIVAHLHQGEPIYPAEYFTDQMERFLVAEIIREKVLHHTRQELPYSTAVLIDDFDESRREKGFVRIIASIIVEKPGQKKIVIGRGGRMIKQIGMEARREIERLLQVDKIYLDLQVRVVEDWRNREPLLGQLGVGNPVKS